MKKKRDLPMRNRKYRQKPTALPVYGPLGPEDGVDPRTEARDRQRPVHNRKALQLCSQVAETLHSVLQGECDDEVLRDLHVQSVGPAPDSTRLLVTVSLSPAASDRRPIEVLQHLHQAYSVLRGEVARAIHRRKTPELIFRVADPVVPNGP
jgi:ribosome-binding factor A